VLNASFLSLLSRKSQMPEPHDALPGRATPMPIPETHFVLGTPLEGPFAGMEQLQVGMGCFWGAEKAFWQLKGVHSTAVGYAAGFTPNPTYQEVCSGQTGHNEVVRVTFDPNVVAFDALLRVFWEGHDPTQGMRQGNDQGTQYRSGIYAYSDQHLDVARASKVTYQEQLDAAGYGAITTEILSAPTFYFAETEHQQYLHKNPGGYCGLGGTGVGCPVGPLEAGRD